MLIGKKVTHKRFGEGTVVAVREENYLLTVAFASGQKTFGCLPTYQSRILVFEEEDAQAEFEALAHCAENKRAQAEAEEEEKLLQRAAKAATMSEIGSKKTAPRSNVAFKCNFCDGGSSLSCIGYDGICSDGQIEQNIVKDPKVWCSAENCLCKQYIDKKIDREAIETSLASGNLICYESSFFRTWSYRAGETLKGKAKTMRGVQKNSLCFMTTQLPDAAPKDRIIFAAFLIGSYDEGDAQSAGEVTAHPDHRIALTLDEAKQIKFWDFYQNKSERSSDRWNTGLFRYLDDRAAVKILKAIADVKQDAAEKAAVERMIDYFCKVNGLDLGKLLA